MPIRSCFTEAAEKLYINNQTLIVLAFIIKTLIKIYSVIEDILPKIRHLFMAYYLNEKLTAINRVYCRAKESMDLKLLLYQ